MPEYVFTRHPGITESGAGTALRIESEVFQSVRSGLGLMLRADERTTDGGTARWSADASLLWHREFLDEAGRMTARFAEDPSTCFDNAVFSLGRDSAALGAGIRFGSGTLTFSLRLTGDVFSSGVRTVGGHALLRRVWQAQTWKGFESPDCDRRPRLRPPCAFRHFRRRFCGHFRYFTPYLQTGAPPAGFGSSERKGACVKKPALLTKERSAGVPVNFSSGIFKAHQRPHRH